MQFVSDDFEANCCLPPQAQILDSIFVTTDSEGRPVRTVFIAGTRRDVNNLFSYFSATEDKRFESELRVMHEELGCEVNRSAHHDYKVGNARVLITTGGMIHYLNLETDRVNMMFWGSQSKITAESLVSHVADTGEMGRHGCIRLYFWLDKNEVDAFAKLLYYFDKRKPPGHSKRKWLFYAQKLLKNYNALTEQTGEPQYSFESSLRQIAQWVGGEQLEEFEYFWPTLAVAQSNTNPLRYLEDA